MYLLRYEISAPWPRSDRIESPSHWRGAQAPPLGGLQARRARARTLVGRRRDRRVRAPCRRQRGAPPPADAYASRHIDARLHGRAMARSEPPPPRGPIRPRGHLNCRCAHAGAAAGCSPSQPGSRAQSLSVRVARAEDALRTHGLEQLHRRPLLALLPISVPSLHTNRTRDSHSQASSKRWTMAFLAPYSVSSHLISGAHGLRVCETPVPLRRPRPCRRRVQPRACSAVHDDDLRGAVPVERLAGSESANARNASVGDDGQGPADPHGTMYYDDIKSDDDYIVIEGKDIFHLIDQLRAEGLDDLGPSTPPDDNLYHEAAGSDASASLTPVMPENVGTDQKRKYTLSPDPEKLRESARARAKEEYQSRANTSEPCMEYFTEDNLDFMPSWLKKAFQDGSHQDIELGSSLLEQNQGTRRLDAMVAADRQRAGQNEQDSRRRDASFSSELEENGPSDENDDDAVETSATTDIPPETTPRAPTPEEMRETDDTLESETAFATAAASEATPRTDQTVVTGETTDSHTAIEDLTEEWDGSGVFDCSVSDVSLDYNVPIEFVMDIMISFGASTPIKVSDGIRDRMTSDEIQQMLLILTSFDAMDLCDRYSDRTLRELSEDLEFPLRDMMALCETEGIYLALGDQTRLQLSREDRIVDIMRGVAGRGQSYSHILEGLIVTEGSEPVPNEAA